MPENTQGQQGVFSRIKDNGFW